MKTTRFVRLFALASLLTASPLPAQTPAPHLIPFQGRLTDQAGTVQPNGQYTITFNLYDAPVGGTTLWTERHEKVSVINGTVNIFLGSIQTINAIDFTTTKHLGITVDADGNPATSDPEMVPRQMIIPAFHAHTAANTTKLAGHDWSSLLTGGSNNPSTGTIRGDKIEDNSVTATKLTSSSVSSAAIQDGSVDISDIAAAVMQKLVPPGSIMPYAGNGIPTGWLLCDGSALAASAYPDLYNSIGQIWGNGVSSGPGPINGAVPGYTNFNVPDLRGWFLRGADRGTSVDPDAASRTSWILGGATGRFAGSYQWDLVGSHNHTYVDAYFSEAGGLGPNNIIGSSSTDYDNGIYQRGMTTNNAGGAETRPRNANVNYLIKY